MTRFTLLILLVERCVRINGKPDRLFSGDIQS